jgi:hypothetical protein
MELAKITARGQTTIPKSIREAAKMEISDYFAGRSALALSFVPIRRGDHA